MTKAELQKYLSDDSNNDEKFSAAMQVLLEQMPPQKLGTLLLILFKREKSFSSKIKIIKTSSA